MPDSEYIFEVDVPSDVENFSNINTDTNPFEVSVKMKAAGNILSNLDARESLYSNAMTNDATLGICPEFIYDEGCKIEEAVIQFKIDDENAVEADTKKAEDSEFYTLFPLLISVFVLSLTIYCLVFPDSFVGENTPIKLFFCTLFYMLGTLAMIGGVYFGISLVVTRFIPTKSNRLVLRCFMYVIQIVLFLLVFIGGFENYFSVYGISSYSDDIKAIKSDYVMMVNSAKDMFSDTETLKDVHFDTMSYLYFENQGRNAVYIDAVDDNDRYTKLMISPGDKSKIDFSAFYDVTYYPNTMTISSLNIVGEYDATEEAEKKSKMKLRSY